MPSLLDKAKRTVKKLQQMQKDLTQSTPVEKLTFPESEEDPIAQDQIQTVDISSKSVAKATIVILAILLLAYFLYEIQGLLVLFFISLFFASALDPPVDWLEKRKIPRSVGVLVIMMLLLGLFVVVIGSAIPIIVTQITTIASSISVNFVKLFEYLKSGAAFDYLPETIQANIISGIESINIELAINQMLKNFSNFAQQIKDLASGVGSTVGVVGAGVTSVTVSIAEFFFNLVLVFFLIFFMVVDKNNLHDFFQALFPKKYGAYISKRTEEIQKQIGAWLRGTLLLSLIMFVITFIGLLLIGMGKFALTLALIMGIGEMIPYIGPLIFLVFSLPIAFSLTWVTVVKLLIFYAVLQTLEGNVLVPAVMNKVVGLSPIIVILVLIVGWHFLGIIGAIIAVPVTTAVAMFVRDYMRVIENK